MRLGEGERSRGTGLERQEASAAPEDPGQIVPMDEWSDAELLALPTREIRSPSESFASDASPLW